MVPVLLPWCRMGAAVAALLSASCASVPEAAETMAPPSSAVTGDEAWRDAKLVAGGEEGRMAAVGVGASMQPLYGDDTVLVLSPIPFEELQPGMTVAYRGRSGRRVVHKLVEREGNAWIVIGLNNDRVDEDRVTRWNLIGVVYATFNSGS